MKSEILRSAQNDNGLWVGPPSSSRLSPRLILRCAQDDTGRGCVSACRDLSARQSAQPDFVDVARGFNRRALYPQNPLSVHAKQHRYRESEILCLA
jgi:hypothetical protein